MALSTFLDPIPSALDDQVTQQLADVAAAIVRAQDTQAAHELKFLTAGLLQAQGAAQPSAQLAPTVALLDLMLFDTLTQQEALTWIRQNFVSFLADERIDLFRQVRLRLLAMSPQTRVTEKEAMRRALASAEQHIGASPLVIDGQSVPPTVANWITAYRRSSQVPKRTNIERSQFLFDDQTAKSLDESERHVVADTLYMYDLLGLATGENGALDTPDPAHYLDEQEGIVSVEAMFNPLEEYTQEQEQGATRSNSTDRPEDDLLADGSAQSEGDTDQKGADQQGSVRLEGTNDQKDTDQQDFVPLEGATDQKGADQQDSVGSIDLQKEEKTLELRAQRSSDGDVSTAMSTQSDREQDGAEQGVAHSAVAQATAENAASSRPSRRTSQDASAETSSEPFRGLTSPASAKYMSLQGLRSAGSGFVAAMQASTERAKQLSQDSGAQQELLNAFKTTDTYAVYVDMGSESVDAGVALSHVSQERQQMKQPYLLPEEFEVVSQFMRVVSL